jgi:putative aldouronate transport system permease protein
MGDSSVKGSQEKIAQIIICTILTVLALLAVLPFVLLVASSLSDEAALLQQGYGFWPRKFSLFAYEYLFLTNYVVIFRAFGITIFNTVVGTSLSLLIAPMLAYPLSRQDYPRARIVTFLVFFTMLFNGGMVPSYIMWTQVFQIKNTLFAYILPTLVFNGFYIILFKSNFATNIHPALIEAAKIDGPTNFTFTARSFCRYLCRSSPPSASWSALGTGNDWVNGLYYINNTNLYSLQVYLNNMLNNMRALIAMSAGMSIDIGELRRSESAWLLPSSAPYRS